MRHTYSLLALFGILLFPSGLIHSQETVVIKFITDELPQVLSRESVQVAAAEQAATNAMRLISLSPHALRVSTYMDNPIKSQLRVSSEYHREYVQASVAKFQAAFAQNSKQTLQELSLESPTWTNFVVNNSLKTYLQKAIQANDYDTVIKELSAYYGLEGTSVRQTLLIPADVFAASAVRYMVYHPHKMNLRLRELMNSVYCRGYHRNIEAFLKKNRLTLADQENLYDLLQKAYQAYSKEIKESVDSLAVQMPLTAYEEAAHAAREFIHKTGRFPSFNAGPAERKLATTIDLLLLNAHINQFKPINEAVEALQELRQLYPLPILAKERFMEEYKRFVQHHSGQAPRPWHEGEYPIGEALLYDSDQYYLSVDPRWTQSFVNSVHGTLK